MGIEDAGRVLSLLRGVDEAGSFAASINSAKHAFASSTHGTEFLRLVDAPSPASAQDMIGALRSGNTDIFSDQSNAIDEFLNGLDGKKLEGIDQKLLPHIQNGTFRQSLEIQIGLKNFKENVRTLLRSREEITVEDIDRLAEAHSVLPNSHTLEAAKEIVRRQLSNPSGELRVRPPLDETIPTEVAPPRAKAPTSDEAENAAGPTTASNTNQPADGPVALATRTEPTQAQIKAQTLIFKDMLGNPQGMDHLITEFATRWVRGEFDAELLKIKNSAMGPERAKDEIAEMIWDAFGKQRGNAFDLPEENSELAWRILKAILGISEPEHATDVARLGLDRLETISAHQVPNTATANARGATAPSDAAPSASAADTAEGASAPPRSAENTDAPTASNGNPPPPNGPRDPSSNAPNPGIYERVLRDPFKAVGLSRVVRWNPEILIKRLLAFDLSTRPATFLPKQIWTRKFLQPVINKADDILTEAALKAPLEELQSNLSNLAKRVSDRELTPEQAKGLSQDLFVEFQRQDGLQQIDLRPMISELQLERLMGEAAATLKEKKNTRVPLKDEHGNPLKDENGNDRYKNTNETVTEIEANIDAAILKHVTDHGGEIKDFKTRRDFMLAKDGDSKLAVASLEPHQANAAAEWLQSIQNAYSDPTSAMDRVEHLFQLGEYSQMERAIREMPLFQAEAERAVRVRDNYRTGGHPYSFSNLLNRKDVYTEAKENTDYRIRQLTEGYFNNNIRQKPIEPTPLPQNAENFAIKTATMDARKLENPETDESAELYGHIQSAYNVGKEGEQLNALRLLLWSQGKKSNDLLIKVRGNIREQFAQQVKADQHFAEYIDRIVNNIKVVPHAPHPYAQRVVLKAYKDFIQPYWNATIFPGTKIYGGPGVDVRRKFTEKLFKNFVGHFTGTKVIPNEENAAGGSFKLQIFNPKPEDFKGGPIKTPLHYAKETGYWGARLLRNWAMTPILPGWKISKFLVTKPLKHAPYTIGTFAGVGAAVIAIEEGGEKAGILPESDFDGGARFLSGGVYVLDAATLPLRFNAQLVNQAAGRYVPGADFVHSYATGQTNTGLVVPPGLIDKVRPGSILFPVSTHLLGDRGWNGSNNDTPAPAGQTDAEGQTGDTPDAGDTGTPETSDDSTDSAMTAAERLAAAQKAAAEQAEVQRLVQEGMPLAEAVRVVQDAADEAADENETPEGDNTPEGDASPEGDDTPEGDKLDGEDLGALEHFQRATSDGLDLYGEMVSVDANDRVISATDHFLRGVGDTGMNIWNWGKKTALQMADPDNKEGHGWLGLLGGLGGAVAGGWVLNKLWDRLGVGKIPIIGTVLKLASFAMIFYAARKGTYALIQGQDGYEHTPTVVRAGGADANVNATPQNADTASVQNEGTDSEDTGSEDTDSAGGGEQGGSGGTPVSETRQRQNSTGNLMPYYEFNHDDAIAAMDLEDPEERDGMQDAVQQLEQNMQFAVQNAGQDNGFGVPHQFLRDDENRTIEVAMLDHESLNDPVLANIGRDGLGGATFDLQAAPAA